MLRSKQAAMPDKPIRAYYINYCTSVTNHIIAHLSPDQITVYWHSSMRIVCHFTESYILYLYIFLCCMHLTVYIILILLPHSVNCRRFCFWCRQSVVFCLWWNILGTTERICTKFTWKTCLLFGPLLGRVWRSRTKVKGHQGQKWHSSALSVACMRFVFGKTSLASSYKYIYIQLHF